MIPKRLARGASMFEFLAHDVLTHIEAAIAPKNDAPIVLPSEEVDIRLM